MQPGLANVCLLTGSMTIVRQRIEVSIARLGALTAMGIMRYSYYILYIHHHTISLLQMLIPKKRAGNTAHDKVLQKFYRAIYEAVIRHINFGQVKAILLASPGFANSDFFTFMNNEAQLKDDKVSPEKISKALRLIVSMLTVLSPFLPFILSSS